MVGVSKTTFTQLGLRMAMNNSTDKIIHSHLQKLVHVFARSMQFHCTIKLYTTLLMLEILSTQLEQFGNCNCSKNVFWRLL